MIHTTNFYVTFKIHRYVEQTVKAMQKASDTIFPDIDTVEKFAKHLSRILDKNKRQDCSAHIVFFQSGTEGYIALYPRTKQANAVARLDFHVLKGALEYDSENKGFTDVSVRLDGLFWKGGEK